MNLEFERKTVIVTGGASGIGLATAQLFSARGAQVIVVDLDGDTAEQAVSTLESHGTTHHSVAVDISSSSSIESAKQHILDLVGKVDVLANVAGVYPSVPMIETTDEVWRRVLSVNLDGTFYMCRAWAPVLLEQAGAAIVNVISGAARIPYPGLSAYTASKGGVMSFSRVIATELAPSVRVNCLGPGPTVPYSITDSNIPHSNEADDLIPLGRAGHPKEVAEGIVFLASDRASFITGQILHVNGGRSMH